MVRASSVALLLLALNAAAQTQLPQAPAPAPASAQASPGLVTKMVNSHNGGLVTFYSGNRIQDNQSQVATNVLFDQDLAVFKRTGQSLYGTVPNCTSAVRSGGALDAPSGTKYFAVACSSQAYLTTGSGNFAAIGGTISATANTYFKPGLGQLWVTNNVDSLWSTDGVIVSSYPAAPICQLNGIFQSRLLLANCVGGQSTIELSGYQHGSDFTLPAVIVDTSPAIFGLNGLNDGRAATCVFDGFRDVAILWNHDEMYGLYGSGNSTFVLRKLAEIGCDEQESVQEFDGHLKWLSQFGIYEYDGLTPKRISDDVKDQIANIIGTEPGALSVTQDVQTDWQGGNLAASGPGAPMSATIAPGSVVPSTWSTTDASSAAFARGTLGTAVSTNSVPGTLALAVSSYSFVNGNFSVGDFTNWTQSGVWSIYGSGLGGSCGLGTSTNNGLTQSLGGGGGFTYVLSLLDASGNTLRTCNVVTAACGSTSACKLASSTCDIVGNAVGAFISGSYGFNTTVNYGTVNLKFSDGVDTLTGTTGISGATAAMSIKSFYSGTPGFQQTAVSACGTPNYQRSGTFLSAEFDTAFSTPVWGTLSASVSLTTTTEENVAFYTQTSTSPNNDLYTSIASSSDTQRITSASKRYIRYRADFSTSLSTKTPTVSSVGLNAATTGYFITSCLAISPITSWGAIQANTLAGNGALTFYVSTGASCAAVQLPTVTWTAQTINTNISVATAAYLGVRVLFDGFGTFYSTAQPTLQSLTVNWSGAAGRPRTASQVYNNRYWLAYTTNTSASAANDSVLINDENGHWSKFSGINAASLLSYQRHLYAGSSANDGKVVLQDSGLSDLGNPISIDFRSPDYELDGFNYVDLYDLSLEFKQIPAASTATPTLQYFADISTAPFTLGTLNLYKGTPGTIYRKARFGQGQSPTKVHTLSFEVQDTSFAPITFYRSQIRFTPQEGP